MNHRGCVGLYFRCLESLLKRGELDLNSLGFDSRKPGKSRGRKLEIGLKYQNFSYEILDQVLRKVLQKGLSDFQRKFIEFYLAHCYFRVPKFRLILLLSMENFQISNTPDRDDLYTRNQSVYDVPLGPGRTFGQHGPGDSPSGTRGADSRRRKKNGKKMNIHQFDTLENFSGGGRGVNPADFETDDSKEAAQRAQKARPKKARFLSNQLRKHKKSSRFKFNLNKGNFKANDKLIKSFTPNDEELQESLNEISGMDLNSPDVYATNQEDERRSEGLDKNVYRTVQEDSLETEQLGNSGIMPRGPSRPTRHRVIGRKKKPQSLPWNLRKENSTAKFEDDQARAEEVGKMLNQDLRLEKPDKSMKFVLLSWEKDFYEHICEEHARFEQREKDLIKMLSGDWRKKFHKKGVIFFFFIIEWCAYVKSTLVVKSISWSKIPGYAVG